MSVYYPQAAITLRVIFEDFNFRSDARLQAIYKLPIIARRVSVHINDYSQADTFDAEIDYKQFPFDPRSIRACGVTVSMEDMGAIFETENGLQKISPDDDNTIFQGFADTESISFDDAKRTVRLEGRDFTSLLIDRKYIGGTINLGQPLDVIIANLLADLKETVELKVDNRVPNIVLPTIGKFSSHMTTAPKNGTMRNQNKEETYWEVIQDLVARSGLIAYIELDKLVISQPRVLYSRNTAVKFIYGRNIKNLEYKRHLGRKKNFNIAVRSLNTTTKEVLQVEIPAEATSEWSKETGVAQTRVQIPTINADGTAGKPKDAPVLSFRVPDVNDKPHLVKIGQELYEELGRQQLDGSFTTKDLEADQSGATSCFNMFKLRNGTPVSILIDQGDLKGISALSTIEEKKRFLENRCYTPIVAEILARTMSNHRFNAPFYTKSVQFTLDADTGVDIKVDFLNFIDTPEKLQ